jgi:hypothetical protein
MQILAREAAIAGTENKTILARAEQWDNTAHPLCDFRS